ncbi:tail assembly chaperone [Holdemanella sp.]|uniref:tail assembly chaperone n=1 Tax=Holdemanella sp. TaxID=1971762 RepID=UPI003AF08FF5
MNMQLEINGTTFEFRFGIGFMKEIQSRYKEMASISVAIPNGFKYVVASMLDGHIEDLFDILYTANKTEKPRITEKALMEYLEDESTDIESLIQEVKSFLLQANASKSLMNQIMEALAEEEEAETETTTTKTKTKKK